MKGKLRMYAGGGELYEKWITPIFELTGQEGRGFLDLFPLDRSIHRIRLLKFTGNELTAMRPEIWATMTFYIGVTTLGAGL